MRRSGVVSLVVFVFLTAGATATMVALSDHAFDHVGWEAFDVVVVPDTYSIERVENALTAAGLSPLTAANATIRLEDFNGQEEISIAELPRRFDEADPRLDPFIRSVSQLFRIRHGAAGSHIVYLPRASSMVRRYRTIHAALDDVPFYLAGWQPLARILSATAALLILFGVVGVTRRRPALSVTIALCGIAYVFFQGPMALMGGVATALSAIYAVQRIQPLEREWLLHHGRIALQDDHVRVVFLLVGSVVIAMTGVAMTPGEAGIRGAAYAAFVLSLISAYAAAVVVKRMRLYRSEHPLFSPRPILGVPWRPRHAALDVFPGLRGAAVAVVVAFVAIHVYTDSDVFSTATYIPVPEHRLIEPGPIATPTDGVDLLNTVAVIDPRQTPLSVAGFLAHRRYQRSVMFGGQFAVPAPDDAVSLTRFRRENGSIVAWEEEQLRYDGAWVLAEYDVTLPSVYALFVEEGGVFSVVPHRLFVSSVPSRLIPTQIGLLFVVVLPLLLRFRLPYRDGIGTVAVASRSERR